MLKKILIYPKYKLKKKNPVKIYKKITKKIIKNKKIMNQIKNQKIINFNKKIKIKKTNKWIQKAKNLIWMLNQILKNMLNKKKK
jgi:hypothetical protein